MNILVIEDDDSRISFFEEFVERLFPGADFTYVSTRSTACDHLKSVQFDIAFFDHDINPSWHLSDTDYNHLYETGSGIASDILWNPDVYKCPKKVIIHSENPVGSDNIFSKFKSANVPCKKYPFSDIVRNLAHNYENDQPFVGFDF